MAVFLAGALTMSYFIAGMFFLRFWRITHDRLFVHFAAAFWLLASQRVGLAILGDAHEHSIYLYLIRLLAFLIIIVGIIDKNRAETGSGEAV